MVKKKRKMPPIGELRAAAVGIIPIAAFIVVCSLYGLNIPYGLFPFYSVIIVGVILSLALLIFGFGTLCGWFTNDFHLFPVTLNLVFLTGGGTILTLSTDLLFSLPIYNTIGFYLTVISGGFLFLTIPASIAYYRSMKVRTASLLNGKTNKLRGRLSHISFFIYLLFFNFYVTL